MILHGEDIIITDNSGNTYVYAAKSCTVKVQADTIEVCSPTDGAWRTFIAGRKSWAVEVHHLVTTVAGLLPTVGDTANIIVKVTPDGAVAFNGFVTNPTITTGTVSNPDGIYWDYTRKVFLAKKGSSYYAEWVGMSAYEYGCYTYNNEVYTILHGELVYARLSGLCIVTEANLSASKSNLAQGTLRLKGSGALTTTNVQS